MALLCLRTTPINQDLQIPAQLLYKKNIKGNLSVRISNTQLEKDKLLEGLHKRQQEQERYNNQDAKDLLSLHKCQNLMVINPHRLHGKGQYL